MTDKELTRKICRNVKYLCLIRDVRLGEVEKAIGVSVGYISRTHKAASDFSLFKADRIAKYFDIPIEFLFTEDYCEKYHRLELIKLRSEDNV